MNSREQAKLYRAEKGDEAYARQVILTENRYPCCGYFRPEGHHPDCRNHPARKAAREYRRHFGDGIRSEDV